MSLLIEQLQAYTGHKGSVFALATDAAERWLYSAGDDGVVAAWDLHAAQDSGQGILQTSRGIYALACLDDLGLLAAGGSDGTLYLVDLAQRVVRHQYRKTPTAIYGLHYEPERQLLWVLHGQGGLSVLSMPDGEEKGYLRPSAAHLRCLVPDPDGRHWLIGASDHHILRLDRLSGEVVHRWEAHTNSVFALALHPRRGHLLSGGRDAYLRVWEATPPYTALEALPAHNFTLNAIAFAPDGGRFATASRDKTLKVWDSDTYQLLKVIDAPRHTGHTHSVNKIIWLTGDNSLISCSDDRRILRWRIETA